MSLLLFFNGGGPAPLPQSDGWQQPFTPPQRRVNKMLAVAIAAAGTVSVPLPVVPSVASWAQPLSVAQKTRKPLLPSGAVSVPVTETVSLDKWAQPLSEAPKRKQQQPTDGSSFVSVVTVDTETISPDKWWTPLPEPLRVRRPAAAQVQTGPLHELVTVDAWMVSTAQMPQRARLLDSAPSFVPSVAAPAETVTIDKWLTQTQIPGRRAWTANGPFCFEIAALMADSPAVVVAEDNPVGPFLGRRKKRRNDDAIILLLMDLS